MSTTKTLGPSEAELLLRLSAEGKPIFSVSQAQTLIGRTHAATTDLLSTLAGKGWLVRLVPGKYLIVPLEAGLEGLPMADRYVIGREVLAPLPYYVSHYSAMELHQMTTQPVNQVFVTVPRQRACRIIAGAEYRFVYARPRSFWGFEAMWVTGQEQVMVSDLEKTLLDCAAQPHLCGGIAELAKGLWLRKGGLDEARITRYAERLGHKAATKRLGLLLETYRLGRPETLATLRRLVNERYALLDPTLPAVGPHRSSWRLRINVDLDELRAVVWT